MRELSTFTADTTGQLDVLWHDGYTLGVDGAQVGVFEKTDQVGLAGFLQSHDGGALETQVGFEILGDLTDQTLERQFADQQFSALLVTTDFTEGDGSRTVTMWFLHSAGSRCALTCGFGGQLFPGSLSSGGFTCCLLGTCHGCCSSGRLCRPSTRNKRNRMISKKPCAPVFIPKRRPYRSFPVAVARRWVRAEGEITHVIFHW